MYNSVFRYAYLIVILAFLALRLSAQQLEIGDKLPDFSTGNVFNYLNQKLNLRDFHNKKLIILDFWETSCTSCVESFPLLDSLQKKYNKEIQIILVNQKGNVDSIKSFFKKHQKITIPAIPFVTNDSRLSAYFPHVFVPHTVWVDNTKSVRYITASDNTTSKNIEAFLNGKYLALSEKKYQSEYFVENPLEKIKTDWSDNLISYSLLAHCVSGVSIGNATSRISDSSKFVRITRNCSSIADLYATAYSEQGRYNFRAANSVILDFTDTFEYVYPSDKSKMDQWKREYSFNYDLMVPAAKVGSLRDIMKSDLKRYFDLQASIEKRNVRCLVLVRIDTTRQIFSKGGEPYTNMFYQNNDSTIFLRNLPLFNLRARLEAAAKAAKIQTRVVDGTALTGGVDISLSKSAVIEFDINQIRKELLPYGLDFVEMEWPIDMLVLRHEVKQEGTRLATLLDL